LKVTLWKWRKIHIKMIVISFNNERLNDPSANYRFNVWKYFGCKIVNINGTETTDKDKTICKICVNDASYIRPATCQPIFEKNMGLYEVLEVPVDTEKQLSLK
jgi:hypothetical protein